jgi:hypothetical protein
MITMVDEIYDRTYRVARDELHLGIAQAIGRLTHSIGDAFAVLNRIEYEAPWTAKRRHAKRA